MDTWSKVKIDYEQLNFSIDQLVKKYSVTEIELQLRIDLEGWEINDLDSSWPDLFKKHSTIEQRIEVLEYLIHESLYHKAYALEHEVYDRLLEIVDKIDTDFPKSSLDTVGSIIRQFHSLKEMKLRIFESLGQPKTTETENLISSPILTVDDIVGKIDDVNDLKYFKLIIEKIESKESNLDSKPTSGRNLVTRIH